MSTTISAQSVSIGAATTTISASPVAVSTPSAPIIMRTVVKAQSAFAPNTPFVRKDGENRKRIILDYGKLFSAYREDPESIRRTTIPAVPSPEGNSRVELREIHSVTSHRNRQKHIVLIGDENGFRKTYNDTRSILHEVPSVRTSWVASVQADIGDIIAISSVVRGSQVSLFYRIVSFCAWPAESGVSSIRGDIGVNIELTAIREVNIMTADVSVWQGEEELGAHLNTGVNTMFELTQDLFRLAPEDTLCYLEYFGGRYEDDKDDLFSISSEDSVVETHVEDPNDFLLELRDQLVGFRSEVNTDEDRAYDNPLRGTFTYTFSAENDTTDLSMVIPNPRKESAVPAIKLFTTFAGNDLPAWLVNESVLSLGELTVKGVKTAIVSDEESDSDDSDDVGPAAKLSIHFMTRM